MASFAAKPQLRAEFASFREGARAWLEPHALFMALKEAHGGAPWFDWDDDLARRDEASLKSAARRLDVEIARHAFGQFLFFRQLAAVRRHAAERGVQIVGDVPLYVARDSVEVWQRPDLFELDDAGRPLLIAGVGTLLSIAGIYLVRTEEDATQKNLLKALARGINASTVLIVVAAVILAYLLLGSAHWQVSISVIVGLLAGWLIGKWTEYSTSNEFKPTQELADQALTGPATIIIGGVAGVLCYSAVSWKFSLGYDDSLDVVGVHGVGGTWGALATGIFASTAVNPAGTDGLLAGNPSLMVAQVVSVVATIAYSLIVTFVLLKAVDAMFGLRAVQDDEIQGLDLSQHGERAYNS